MTDGQRKVFFEDLISNHKDQIYRICWGFSNNSADVQDLYQDVLINIWKGLKGFRMEAMYSTWIHRITVNTCLLWKKKTKKEKHIIVLGEPIQINDTKGQQGQSNQLHLLKQAIGQLNKSDRSLILLVLEELAYKEIAEITGMSVSNVGVRINRIKKRLKKILQKNS